MTSWYPYSETEKKEETMYACGKYKQITEKTRRKLFLCQCAMCYELTKSAIIIKNQSSTMCKQIGAKFMF